jgi:ubiquinone/menaquinone biosynthesis C-methylase UbiE/uncharacterized protein YbaR (Trm112 family)
MRLDHNVVGKLACPNCNSLVAEQASGGLKCEKCSNVYTIADGVIDFLLDKSLRTTLEDANYDVMAGYNGATIDKIGQSWLTVFNHAGIAIKGKSILEIGAGTGALTLALLRSGEASLICATDISNQFLRKILERAAGEPRLTAIRCDCNRMPVRDGSFDLIIGRSILHHLLDYDLVLAQSARVLKKNGKAVFFEPMLEGKLVVALYAAMIVDLAKRDADPDFTAHELNKIESVIRNITKASWYPQDREALAKLEDKYIFTLHGMREKGLEAGFATAEFFRDDRPVDPSLWTNFVATMRLIGIAPAKLEKYRILSKGYARTFGAFRELHYAPMNYFCFTK